MARSSGRNRSEKSAREAAAETGDIFAGLLLACAAATVGCLAGPFLLALTIGPGSTAASLLGMVVGFLTGVVAAFLSTFEVLKAAATVRWLRRRLNTVWILWEVGSAAFAAAVASSLISRL